MDLDFRGGFFFRLVLRPVGMPRDTVYRALSFRDFLALGPKLDKLMPEEGGGIRARRR